MVDTIRELNIPIPVEVHRPSTPDPSTQDGHFIRGRYWFLQQEIRRYFPDLYMRFVPDYSDVVKGWRERRSMMRTPRTGKR